MLLWDIFQPLIKYFARIAWRKCEQNRFGHKLSLDLFRCALDGFAFGHFVIDPFPLALDLDALLWRRMTEARIDPWQRALTHVVQHDHPHGSLLVSRRMGDGVGVAAGQEIHRAHGGIHGHVELLSGHPFCHQCSNAKHTVARDELDPCPASNTPLLREFGRDFEKGVRYLFADSVTSIREVALVKMLEDATIV